MVMGLGFNPRRAGNSQAVALTTTSCGGKPGAGPSASARPSGSGAPDQFDSWGDGLGGAPRRLSCSVHDLGMELPFDS